MLCMSKQRTTPSFYEYTKEVWSEEGFKLETPTDVDNLIDNAVGFFSLLINWDESDE